MSWRDAHERTRVLPMLPFFSSLNSERTSFNRRWNGSSLISLTSVLPPPWRIVSCRPHWFAVSESETDAPAAVEDLLEGARDRGAD